MLYSHLKKHNLFQLQGASILVAIDKIIKSLLLISPSQVTVNSGFLISS